MDTATLRFEGDRMALKYPRILPHIDGTWSYECPCGIHAGPFPHPVTASLAARTHFYADQPPRVGLPCTRVNGTDSYAAVIERVSASGKTIFFAHGVSARQHGDGYWYTTTNNRIHLGHSEERRDLDR